MATQTPWGPAQDSWKVARGIVNYSTPGHGGVHLSKKLNEKVHPAFRNNKLRANGWYEEDIDYNIVILFFPMYYSTEQLESARKTCKNNYPDEFAEAFGVEVTLEESATLRERKFKQDHKNDYLVISAYGDWHEKVPAGYVGAVATKGGIRGTNEVKYFLVPADEYTVRYGFDFVIDETKHQPWSGPHGKV